MTDGTPKESLQGTTVNLPVQWQIPDDAVAAYATNFVIQRMQHEYLISFFQVQPPLILGTPEQVIEKVSHLDRVPARLVGQIVIAEDRLQELQKLLQTAGTLTPPIESATPSSPQE